jgi:hypothetical protein
MVKVICAVSASWEELSLVDSDSLLDSDSLEETLSEVSLLDSDCVLEVISLLAVDSLSEVLSEEELELDFEDEEDLLVVCGPLGIGGWLAQAARIKAAKAALTPRINDFLDMGILLYKD